MSNLSPAAHLGGKVFSGDFFDNTNMYKLYNHELVVLDKDKIAILQLWSENSKASQITRLLET